MAPYSSQLRSVSCFTRDHVTAWHVPAPSFSFTSAGAFETIHTQVFRKSYILTCSDNMVFLVLARKNSFSLKGIRRMHMEKMITVNRMTLNVQIISCLFTNIERSNPHKQGQETPWQLKAHGNKSHPRALWNSVGTHNPSAWVLDSKSVNPSFCFGCG